MIIFRGTRLLTEGNQRDLKTQMVIWRIFSMNTNLNNVQSGLVLNDKDKDDTAEAELFSSYVSTEPQAKLPFTGPSASVGRTSSFATTTSCCGSS